MYMYTVEYFKIVELYSYYQICQNEISGNNVGLHFIETKNKQNMI